MGNWSLLVAAVYNLFRLFRAASALEGGGGRGADKKILRRQIKHTGGGFTTTIVFTNIESYGKCGHEGEVREKEEKCVMEKRSTRNGSSSLFIRQQKLVA